MNCEYSRRFQRANEWVLMNLAAENNYHLKNLPRKMAKTQKFPELETDTKTREEEEEEKCGVCSSQQCWYGQVF